MRVLTAIDVDEFDDLVKATYNRPYSYQQQDGCKDRGVDYFNLPINLPEDFENDSIPEIINGEEMGVSFKAWLERSPDAPVKEHRHGKYISDTEDIELFWERNFYPHVEMILSDLHSKGLLPDGELAIDIDW